MIADGFGVFPHYNPPSRYPVAVFQSVGDAARWATGEADKGRLGAYGIQGFEQKSVILTKSDDVAFEEGCRYSADRAWRVFRFFRRFLRHGKGQWAGQPFDPLAWQWDRIIAPYYGWVRPNGTRRFRRFGVAVPKKNGKSTLLGGLGLYHEVGDDETGAEVYTVGADKKQASIIWNEAAEMVRQSDDLHSELRAVRSGKFIYYDAKGSVFAALSSDVNTKEGYNASCVLIDELHAQKGYGLYNALRYAGAARRQPTFGWITTAGYDRQSLCFEQWQYAKSVQESRIIDTEFLPCIYEPDPDDDWTDERTWHKVNPSLGVTISLDDMRAACREAQGKALQENAFKRYRLNMWTAQETKWIAAKDWAGNRDEYTDADLLHAPCIAGLDLSTTTDVTALVLVFRLPDGSYRLIPRFWVPYETIALRERDNRVRISQWAGRYINVTQGNVIDYNVIRREINELACKHKIEEVAIDAWNHSQITTDLQGDGFAVTPVRTGFATLSPAAKEFERLVLSRTLRHNGNPVMDWMVDNLAVETDASGNIKPSKKKSPEKIDGPVAVMLALALFLGRAARKPSRYEKGGVRYV